MEPLLRALFGDLVPGQGSAQTVVHGPAREGVRYLVATLNGLFGLGLLVASFGATHLDAWLAFQVRLFVPLGAALLCVAWGLLARRPLATVLGIAVLAVLLGLSLVSGFAGSPFGLAIVGTLFGQIAALVWIRPRQVRPAWGVWEGLTVALLALGFFAGPLTDPLPPSPTTVLEPDTVTVWSYDDVESAVGELRSVAVGSIVLSGHFPGGEPWFVEASQTSDPNLNDCARIQGPAWADGGGVVIPLETRSDEGAEQARYGVRLALAAPSAQPGRPFGADRYAGSFCIDQTGEITDYDPPYLIGY